MDQSAKCFTFIWKIKNCRIGNYLEIIWKNCRIYLENQELHFWLRNEIESPSFVSKEMSETSWNLYLYFNSRIFKDSIACYIHRACYDQGPDQYELDYELSFLAADGSVLCSEKYLQKKFANGGYDNKAFTKKRDELEKEKSVYIPDDTLTIRCRMWDKQKTISQSGRCSAETSLETKNLTYVGIIEEFSCLEENRKYIVRIISPSIETVFLSMYASFVTDGKLVVDIKLGDVKDTDLCRCEIFIRDVFGNKVKTGHDEILVTETYSIPLTVLKEQIMKNKGIYIPNDTLTLECSVCFSTGRVIKKIDEPEYGFDCEGTAKMVTCKDQMDLNTEEHDLGNLKSLKDDWISVFKEGILCDTKLKTATETFPVHAIVLSARSPVFKSMFTTDMREKTNKCVDIDDLDADTVRLMLSFMYSASLEGLQYESAKSLYFAADKYQIISLKQSCSHFMKQNLMERNCCEILLLADQHQDEDLKVTLQDYIAKNDKAVLSSDEWKKLEKSHSQLTTEVFRFIYFKNRIN